METAAHQHPAWKASPGSVAEEPFWFTMLKAALEGDNWAPAHLSVLPCQPTEQQYPIPCVQLPCHFAGSFKKKK